MKQFLIICGLFASLSIFAGTTNTNYLWSLTNVQTQFGYSATNKSFTNGITIGVGSLNITNTNAAVNITAFELTNKVSLLMSSNAYRVLMFKTNGQFVGTIFCASNAPGDKLWIYSIGFDSNQPTLGHPAYPYTVYHNSNFVHGVPGMTTNTLVAAPGSKTNQLQFSEGILTNIVNNY